MKSDTRLDYAVFQLSPRRSRCELLVTSDGDTEKLASGSVKPFATHLKVAEQQVALAVQSIKLEAGKSRNAETWFTKGTLERFVRFVSTPEVVELVNTLDAEMSQLEAARKIYSEGMGDQHSGALGGEGAGTTAAADATKKELLRAIDVRLSAVKQDLTTAYARASAAGFNPDAISDLQAFADRFGAHRLNEACTKFVSLCQRRPDLSNGWKPSVDDSAVRSSYGSDMSIDDPAEDSSETNLPPQTQIDQSRRATCQETKSHVTTTTTSTSLPTLRNNVNVKNEVKEETAKEELQKEKEEPPQSEPSSSSTPVGPLARRLSVQDRINLFENKQKEQSSAGSGGKLAVGKSVELRRLSSDVSSVPPVGAERAVLRRWSGASDMSLDLSGEKKDTESPLCTPFSASSVSHAKSNNIVSGGSEAKDQKGLNNDSASSSRPETRTKDQAEEQIQVAVSNSRDGELGLKMQNSWKEEAVSQPQFKFSFPRAEHVGLNDHKVSQEKSRSSNSEDQSGGFKEAGSVAQSRGSSERVDIPGVKFQVGSQTQPGSFSSKGGDVSPDGGFVNKAEDFEQVAESVIPSRPKSFHGHSRSSSGQFDFGGGLKLKEAASTSPKWAEADQLPPQPEWKSLATGFEGGEGEFMSSGRQQLEAEDSGYQKMKLHKPISSSRDPVKRSQVKSDESNLLDKESKLDFTLKKVTPNQESLATMSKPPVEQVQRVRQTKGNQELNDELKMKANELEKLFAEHKLRVPVDQSGLARRSKPADVQVEGGAGTSSRYKKPIPDEIAPIQLPEKSTVIDSSGGSSDAAKFSTPVTKKVDAQDSGDSLRKNFSDLGFSDDSRGKFYERYMQKRDAKLREELGSKGVERKAKLKAMQESLEQSSAELKAKFSGSSERQDSVSSARWRAEKLRSFNVRSSLKRGQSIESLPSEEEEDPSEFTGQKFYGQDRFLSEGSSGEGASRPSQTKKSFPNRNLSSSTPRTNAAPAPRSSAKLSNSNSGRRRAQAENPMAQSVPNFSDLRKENTKPSSGASKTAMRSQVRSYVRSKSTNEEAPNIKEDKARRSHALRKSSANPVEFKDLSSLDSEGVVFTQLKFDKEQTEQSMHEKLPKNSGAKPFLRKGNGIGPGSGASIAKLKASVAAETLQNEEFTDLGFEAAESVDTAKEEEVEEEEDDDDEEIEAMAVEDSDHIDNGKSRLSQESEKSGNLESDNGDSTRSLSQIDPTSVAELPAPMPSAFHPVGALQDSPGESPVSWNSQLHHPFSYPNETSDIDASVDSPIGSPASWNSHGLTQTEAEAARMRKKWGSAQKPVIAANSSYNQSRKDMTKGFKRLLKFGRKNRGTESLMDWISATTSEGDDDTEEGRDLANRSSEDLRKSRMGFFQEPSDDSFNEHEFNEQVQSLQSSIPAPPVNFKLRDEHLSGSSLKAPRSFFSLSSFRSKGSDSKLR